MEFGKQNGKSLIGKRQLMQFEIIYFYNLILLKYFSEHIRLPGFGSWDLGPGSCNSGPGSWVLGPIKQGA